ncbi:MarR family winged helix-turn-helix transcriptional regulator [Poseidonibacter lekithochrous]|uniref:MarR family winged helix-turn-helix transcriptional regulator n=1 Tax=Poseidonibacter lekithochrous TaxID=1904463 RepID=UPI0008FCC3CA|nr:MarR family winged helix-turn-helix transcriptional regulator [Poseidonibacter lekithochrous]QKJ21344.1 transcriptional regulator, MarR family [Poseidonibacter lekithochrous]
MPNTNAIIATIASIHNSSNKLIVEELKKHNLEGLAPSHGDILVHLYEHEDGVPMNKITASINKDKSTVTALVNKLEKLELLEKFKNENDSRSTMVKLTQKGLDTKPIVMGNISKKLLDITYENFTKKEKELVCKLLEKIKDNFN